MEAEAPAAWFCDCDDVMAAETATVASTEGGFKLCCTRKAWAAEPHVGCRAALRVRYSLWEYRDSMGTLGPGQSMTHVKFIKRSKDLAEYGSRPAGTSLSHCRNLGRDSAPPPLGLAFGVAAEDVVPCNTCGESRTGARGTAESHTAAQKEANRGSAQRAQDGSIVVAPSILGARCKAWWLW